MLSIKEHTEAHGDKITGYRKLNDGEISLINEIKVAGRHLDDLIEQVKANAEPDGRWLAMAKTDLQCGIMKLVRSVAKPDGF